MDERINYGKMFQNRKKIVPTRPHTSSPEKPAMLEEVLFLCFLCSVPFVVFPLPNVVALFLRLSGMMEYVMHP